jgi:predicted Zn finger-like uncharacterized protein
MYTQCPKCSTIFTMTEADLGAHQGLVRCGRCQEVFNASWNFVGSLPDEALPDAQSAPTDRAMEASDTPMVKPEIDQQDIDLEYDWETADLEIDITSEQNEDAMQADADAAETMPPGDVEFAQLLEDMQSPEPGDVAEAERGLSALEEAEPAVEDKTDGDDADGRSEPKMPLPGDITEEIVIEAPANLWGFDYGTAPEETAPGGISTSSPDKAESPGLPGLQSKGVTANSAGSPVLKPRKITVSHKASDVKLVEIPHPKPLRSIAWAAAIICLALAVVWQVKTYYLSDLAEIASLRSPLESFCDYAACTVPARTDIKSIDLISTSVDPHPDTPGALRVSANLINRARFAQQFPPLEVTLTDKAGAVVGRRTYLPHEYLSGTHGAMQSNVVQRADLDLAQPAQTAVGYEIQLVAR